MRLFATRQNHTHSRTIFKTSATTLTKSTSTSDIDEIEFNTIEYKDTISFIPPIQSGKVIKIYDGDSITVAAKFSTGSPWYRFAVRLRGIDSPEIKGHTNTEIMLAFKARDALHQLIFGKIITLKNNGREKYGRLLADIYLGELHINQWMLDNHYAVPYDGGKKIRPKSWDMDMELNILKTNRHLPQLTNHNNALNFGV